MTPRLGRATLLLIAGVAACGPRQWTGDPKPLDRIVATSAMTFGISSSVRVLSDGRVLITDERASQLWMLDRDLKTARLIGDSTPATNRLMSIGGTYIRPYLNDSTMLVKSGLGDGVVLDEQGRAIREVRFRDGLTPGKGPFAPEMVSAPFTKRGELMILSVKPMNRQQRAAASVETVYVVRTSFSDPNKRDTVGQLTRQMFKPDTTLPQGVSQMSWIRTGDAAGMLPDGAIAIVRTKGYRVDWIDRRGKTWTTPIPHEWALLTPAGKQEVMDSLRASARRSGVRINTQMTGNVGSFQAAGAESSVVVTKLGELPDTVPPISTFSQVRADGDGNLWIDRVMVRTNPYRSVPGSHFDVIDDRGRLVRRVVLPQTAQVKAFTRGRVYYTVVEGGRRRLVIARTR